MANKFSGKILLLSLLIFVFLFQIASAWSATVSGTVKIEGKNDKSGVLVTVHNTSQGRSLSGATDKDGKYSIQNVPSGSYTMTAQKPGNISAIRSDVAVSSGSVTVDFQLIPGDLKIDNQINLLDRVVLSSVWKSKEGDVNWNSMMDIYEDGVIDEKDRDLLLANWRKGNPTLKLGALSVDSNPREASILINGADTGLKTPYTFPGLIVGEYMITLQMKNYAPVEVKAQVNENQSQVLPTVTLDNQPPEFTDWATDPVTLTEKVKGRLQITVRVTDVGGSGMDDKIPQFDYHIGAETKYSTYKPMKSQGDNLWSFDISEPAETWDFYRGKYIYYKVKAEDAAGNSGESIEQQKLIVSINDAPTVRIINTFGLWQKGLITMTAEASDVDGTVAGVQFEYSFDNATWTQIGLVVTASPYSVSWDTKTIIRDVMKNVWVRATATDNENASVQYVIPTSFGIDNQSPTATHDYDGLWHNNDFAITLRANDGNGIGVSTISYKLNNGNKQDIELDGQTSVSVVISKEDQANALEYWSTDTLGNEEQHKTLSNIKLDKTPPAFTDWKQDPVDLTEDTVGSFRIYVQVADNGSGLTGKIPQIDYHIGSDTQYNGYKNMISEDGKTWYFNILEPQETWDSYRGKYLYYKVKCEDVAGNVGESPDRAELIENINDPPVVKIISTYNPWQKGVLKIEATASDPDGTVMDVQFAYAFDKVSWRPIGAAVATLPYSIEWDTTASIQQAPTIWIQATATDNNGATATYIYPASIGIDNQPPVTSDDYNDLWHKQDFAITLTASDGNGIGISDKNIKYKLNNGEERNVLANGHPKITEEGIHQLEYWSVDDIGNTEIHHTIPNIKLDKTSPVFTDWTKDPMDLTENSTGSFRIYVRATDVGSDLTGKIPQFSYHIGKDTVYGEYVNMLKGESKDVWYYDILEPAETWDAYRGKSIYYKAKIDDVAGNQAESPEQQELIDDINDPPTVKIATSFNPWEKGQLKIDAEASDQDGVITNVEFEYSSNKTDWTPIGTVTTFPYSILWDTKTVIPQVSLSVWIKATATDDDGDRSKESIILNSFKVDNEAPATSHNYDGTWQNKNFIITLTANDKNGIGVSSISYKLNDAEKQTVSTNGQTGVPVSITTEGANTLEYWSVDSLGNEETHKILSNINLDKTLPKFSNWEQIPADLTEDTTGKFRVSLQITDSGSGLTGKITQFDYHIGTETKYEGYKNMTSEDGTTWYFDIPEPTGKWDSFRDQYVYYKVKIEDVAKNSSESLERKELIDSINDPPVVNMTGTFNDWETKEIELKADASDADGSVPSVQFEFSTDNTTWKSIGTPDNTSPYSLLWDTRLDIPDMAKSVWVRAVAIDSDDKTVSVKSEPSSKFSVDNQPPVAGNWTKSPDNLTEDTTTPFRVTVEYSDGEGSGMNKVEIAYKIGTGTYKDYREMQRESATSNTWYYEISEIGGWDQYRGKILSYKARATDAVGNLSQETQEQQELIDDINDPPTGLITSSLKDWERGSVYIQASATDQDGEVTSVQFQYSIDNTNWVNIGAPSTRIPYSVNWDTTAIEVANEVWLKIIVTDDDKASTEVLSSKSFGIDNKQPALAKWKLTPENLTESSTEPFLRVEVEVTDQGSGLDETKVQLDYHISKSSLYVGYQTMYRESGNIWFYEIPRPLGSWSSYASQTVYYKIKATDKVGNFIESEERSELIDSTTGALSGTVTPRETWRLARVTVLQNAQNVLEVAVSQIDGSYSIASLNPGVYNLQISALGYGTDKSQTNIEVKVGQASTVPNVELYTYAVETISRSQGGKVEFRDTDAKDYSLIVDSSTLLQDSKVVLGFSGIEPTSVPNPTVRFMGRSIGVGFEGKEITKPLKLIIPRPSGITDTKTIMVYIYNGSDYRLINRNDIGSNDTTITVYVTPPDVQNFSDSNHKFDKVLSRISDTVFYVLITKFEEPQMNTVDIGIRDPQLSSGRITGYLQPNVVAADRKIALVVHGIASKADDLASIIADLRSLKSTDGTLPYYNQVLVFNYESGLRSIATSSSSLATELARILPTNFSSKIDVIAHGTGALVVRHGITNRGLDSYIGSLIMLAPPNNGMNVDLIKAGFNGFLKKIQSDPIWTYYRDGWQEIFENSQILVTLNNQPGRNANAHYYAIAASDPYALNDAENNDGLVYLKSVDFTNNINFPFLEQALTEKYEKVDVMPYTEGKGFMSQTRHLAILTSSAVRDKIMTYLRGKSENIKITQNDIDLIPGNKIEEFKVVLKNAGTDTVYGVTAQLNTQSTYIRKYSGQQGIEKDIAVYGDMAQDQTTTKSFSFTVSPDATSVIGQLITFALVIRNSRDSSISVQEFTAPIGGNLVRIALNSQTQEKLAAADALKDVSRQQNDNDISVEPGETMNINITLENRSTSSMQSVQATLKTDDPRLKGLVGTTEVNMATNGITVDYGTFTGLGMIAKNFQYVKLNNDPTLLGTQVTFNLEIKSGQNVIGRDTFTVKIGANIVVTDFSPDRRLIPGGGARNIDVTIKNITSSDISNIDVRLTPDAREVDLTDSRIQVDLLRALNTDGVPFEATIDADFTGYVTFTIEIRANNQLINVETYKRYFGMRTQYIADWITSDGEGTYSDKIAEPGESVRLQIARKNPTNDVAPNVEAKLITTDPSISLPLTRDLGDYRDIPADSVAEARREYEFTVIPDITVASPSGSILSGNRLTLSTASWTPSAFKDRLLNPNTTGGAVQHWFLIADNGTNWIDVAPSVNLASYAANGNPFQVRMGPAGHTVEFTLQVDENGETVGEELYSTRIGGAIRYLPPVGYSGLMATISDAKTLSASNNGNGIPEPGEKIELTVTLINTGTTSVDNVVALLDTDNNDVRIDSAYDEYSYGKISSRAKKQGTYRFTIDTDIKVDKIPFQLEIDGDISYDGINFSNLGVDTFVIPVKRPL
jgi:hypothetical protein